MSIPSYAGTPELLADLITYARERPDQWDADAYACATTFLTERWAGLSDEERGQIVYDGFRGAIELADAMIRDEARCRVHADPGILVATRAVLEDRAA